MTAHARLAALLILAQHALTRHLERHPRLGSRDYTQREDRLRVLVRRDALADAYALVVAEELGLHALLTDRPALLAHAAQQVARQAVTR